MPRERKKKGVVREPIQVYLTEPDRALLDSVAATAGLSRAEVLRRGLRRFGSDVLATAHPVLQFLEEATTGWPADTPTDVSQRLDDYLADSYADRRQKRKR